MKKYALFLFVFAFVFGLFSVNSVSAYDSGCTSAGPYSTTTGQLCVATAFTDCKPGHLFSSVTGKPCSGSQPGVSSSPSQIQTVSSNVLFKQELAIGSRGGEVKILQQILKDQGYYFGKVDGSYGKRTARAVKDFQDDNDLTITGKLDTETIGKIVIVTPVDSTNPPSDGGGVIQIPVNAPVISGVSGPQTLNVGQQGKWSVAASDSSGGDLSYSANWGDEVPQLNTRSQSMMTTIQQSATFTHSYSQAGTYIPVFTVTNSNGQSAQTSLSVNVGGAINTNISEQVKCVFDGSQSEQKCYTAADADSIYYNRGCSGVETCVVDIKGNKGDNITWKSSCGGYAYTTMDGQSEYANFNCATITTNSSPKMGPIAVLSNIKVGQSVNFNFSATDADNDDLSWSVDWGEGVGVGGTCMVNPPGGTGKNWNHTESHTWTQAGTYTVKVTVYDCKGGTTETSFTVTVDLAVSSSGGGGGGGGY